MSDIGQQVFSSMGGSYSLEVRLQNIRAKLSQVNTAVRNLESNMIFLLVNPELVNYAPSQSSDSSSEQQSADAWDFDQHSVVISNPRTDYGQEQFLTNPTELHGLLADSMGARHDLMVNESEILSALYEQNKKAHYDNVDSAYNDSL